MTSLARTGSPVVRVFLLAGLQLSGYPQGIHLHGTVPPGACIVAVV